MQRLGSVQRLIGSGCDHPQPNIKAGLDTLFKTRSVSDRCIYRRKKLYPNLPDIEGHHVPDAAAPLVARHDSLQRIYTKIIRYNNSALSLDHLLLLWFIGNIFSSLQTITRFLELLTGKMVESEATQASDLQWMVMACDPSSVERETCDELPVSEEKYEDEYETSPSQEPNLLSVSLAK